MPWTTLQSNENSQNTQWHGHSVTSRHRIVPASEVSRPHEGWGCDLPRNTHEGWRMSYALWEPASTQDTAMRTSLACGFYLSIYPPTYLYIYIDMCVALNTILHHLIAKHRSAVDASHGSIAVTCSKQLASYTGRDLPCPPAPSQKRRPWHTNNSGK